MAREIVASEKARVASTLATGDMSGRLQRAVLSGFDRVDQFLAIEASDGDSSDATEKLREKQALLATQLIRAQLHVDDSALRSEREDRFLEIIERANATLPPPERDD